MAVIVSETSPSSQSCSISIQTILEKNGIKHIKLPKKLLQRCIFYPITKEPDTSNGVEIYSNNYFFEFLLPFVMYQRGFDLFNLSSFIKNSLDRQFEYFVLSTSL